MSQCVHCGLPVPALRREGGSTGSRFCCFGCRFAFGLARPASTGDEGGGPPTTLVLRLGLGIFLAINIMVFSWVFYSTEVFGPVAAPGETYEPLVGLFAYLLMFLCTVLVVTLGFPLAGDALDRLRAPQGSRFRILGRIDTNLLICIGVGAAYVLSVVHTLRGAGSLYFDTAAMVLVIVTLGQYLEAGAKRRAVGAAETRLADLPRQAWVRRNGRLEQVDTSELCAGDEVRVRAGEAVPADGRVIDGSSRIDESSLTGESRPRAVQAGDHVLGGSVSLDGALWLAAESVGRNTAVVRVQRMLDQARLRQPAIQRAADRIAAWFVPGVVLFAALLFARQAWIGEATRGLFVALSVLLISCPCALGLAAPLACWNALRRAAGSGIVIDSSTTLERAAGVRRVFLDKTGTLTGRRLQLARLGYRAGRGARCEDSPRPGSRRTGRGTTPPPRQRSPARRAGCELDAERPRCPRRRDGGLPGGGGTASRQFRDGRSAA
jgi:cation transport ATPase